MRSLMLYVYCCALPFIVCCTHSASIVHCNAPALKCNIMHHNAQMLMLCIVVWCILEKSTGPIFHALIAHSKWAYAMRLKPMCCSTPYCGVNGPYIAVQICICLIHTVQRQLIMPSKRQHKPALSPTCVLVLLAFNTKRIQSFQENDKTAIFSSILYMEQRCTSNVFVANTV